MFFDSPVYFAFLLLLIPAYWALAHRKQNVLLLIASYFFYGWWDYRFLGLIIVSTVVDFFCARVISRSQEANTRRLMLSISVIINLAFLGFFKYYNFFADSLVASLDMLGVQVSPKLLSVVLPPGISFYTFQAVAYIVDVYNRRLEPAESIVDYALFISLFPHLIAGPIQRPGHLLPQVQHERRFNAGQVFDGLMLILTGLFRKCVVADNCALIANAAFGGQLGDPSIGVFLLGAYAFAWQIYGDFSGYSDIARGSAQLLGFHFMVNFRQPYLSASIQDFWRRWHISLSTWLRDYLYIPLGGSRGGERRASRNLATTMLLGGLWHGANWTFVIWGGLHGLWLAAERTARQHRNGDSSDSLAVGIGKKIVVFHGVCLLWIFFRAPSVSDALVFIKGVTVFSTVPNALVFASFLACAIAPLLVMDLIMERTADEYPLASKSYGSRIVLGGAFVLALLAFSANSANSFIYFQF